MRLADTIHTRGQAVVWSGRREPAELYHAQLAAFGLTLAPARALKHALTSPGLLEQLLPAFEQRCEVVAGRTVSGDEVDVRPVLGELPLELGDALLGAADLAFDAARAGSGRGARARRGFLARLRGLRRGSSAGASRRRRNSAQPPG